MAFGKKSLQVGLSRMPQPETCISNTAAACLTGLSRVSCGTASCCLHQAVRQRGLCDAFTQRGQICRANHLLPVPRRACVTFKRALLPSFSLTVPRREEDWDHKAGHWASLCLQGLPQWHPCGGSAGCRGLCY